MTLVCAGKAVSSEDDTIHIAILGGDADRAPSEETLALIESEFLKIEDVQFVEREKIRNILQEQELNISGLTDLNASIQVGKLLSADILLILEKSVLEQESPASASEPEKPRSLGAADFPARQETIIRFSFIESRTGIRVLSRIIFEKDIRQNPDTITGLVDSIKEKLQIPVNQRRYVSILSFHSEEPGNYLDGMADAMRVILENDMSQSSSIVVLDREYMQYIIREKSLSGMMLDLKKSFILLEGGIRRDPDNKEIIQTVKLSSLAQEKLGSIQMETSLEKPFANRKEIISAIIDKIDGIQQDFTILDTEKEAKLYAMQASYFLSQRDHAAATRSAEAAMALDPSPKNHELVMRTWYHRAQSVNHDIENYVYWPTVAKENLPNAGKISYQDQKIMFKTEIRYAQATLTYLDKYPIQKLKARCIGTYLNYVLVRNHAALFLPVNKKYKEIIPLRKDLQKLWIAIYQKAFEQVSAQAEEENDLDQRHSEQAEGEKDKDLDQRHSEHSEESNNQRSFVADTPWPLARRAQDDIPVIEQKRSPNKAKVNEYPDCLKLLSVGIQMAPYWSDGIAEHVELAKEMINSWDSYDEVNDLTGELSFPRHLVLSFFDMRDNCKGKDMSCINQLISFEKWLSNHPNPLIKLVGLKVKCSDANTAEIIKLLHEQQLFSRPLDDFFLARTVFLCYRLHRKDRLDKFCLPLLTNLSEQSSGPRIDAYKEVIQQCMESYEKAEKNQGLPNAILESLQEINTSYIDLFTSFTKKRPEDMTLAQVEDNLNYFIKIQKDFLGEGKKKSVSPPRNPLLDKFDITKIPLYAPGGYKGIEKIVQYKDSLIIVWRTWYRFDFYHYHNTQNTVPLSNREEKISLKGGVHKFFSNNNTQDNVPFSIRVEEIPLKGGATKFLGDFTVSIPAEIKLERITSLAANENYVAMGTTESGLILCSNGQCQQYKQKDGLPSNDIASLGWYKGKLFLGHGLIMLHFLQRTGGGGGLSSFDPQTKKTEIIFSSKSQGKNFILDKVNAYCISGLLADPARNCLWLGIGGIRDTSRFSERHWEGLWKFEPETDRLERLWRSDVFFDFSREMAWWRDPDTFAWWKEPYIFGGSDLSIILTDTEKESATDLAIVKSMDSVFGNGDTIESPRALLKEYLLSFTNKKLRFYGKDHQAAVILEKTPDNKEIRNVTELLMLDDGSVIAVINNTDLWRIEEQPKDYVSEEQPKDYLSGELNEGSGEVSP